MYYEPSFGLELGLTSSDLRIRIDLKEHNRAEHKYMNTMSRSLIKLATPLPHTSVSSKMSGMKSSNNSNIISFRAGSRSNVLQPACKNSSEKVTLNLRHFPRYCKE